MCGRAEVAHPIGMVPEGRVAVKTTYVALSAPERFRPAFLTLPDLRVMTALEPLPAFYRFLYETVGRNYGWTGRLAWSEAQLLAHLGRPSVTLLVLYRRGTPAGFLELEAEAAEPGTEIVHLGIVPDFQGQGLGKHLLSLGVAHAFERGAGRVWLHTDNFDGPHALANYLARGFQPYRLTWHTEPA